MNPRAESLYLDLLKKALSFTLWPEPPLPVTTFNYARSALKKAAVSIAARSLDAAGLLLMQKRTLTQTEREQGQIWPGYADTMIGMRRLDSLQECIETVLRDGVEGDLIETGVWRGGACILMRGVLVAYGATDRRVFVADSFEGLPKPDEKKYPADKGDSHHTHRYFDVSKEDVENNFRRYGLLDTQVVFLKGWFKETLPVAPIERLSVMRLDGDMYESTMDALTNLYSKLSSGGFCIIDDYALAGCKAAVDDFRRTHSIREDLIEIDWTGRYWRKN